MTPFPPRIAIASRNPGKIREIIAICSDWPVEWVTADDRWPEVEEIGETYAENALLKAKAVAEATGLPAIADDSGIEVDKLDGAPGVRSARFAGDGATDEENLRKLIEAIRDTDVRTARYRCVAVLSDGTAAEATCEGTLVTDPRGENGFGYDPIFVADGEIRAMAELSPEEKDAISHRGKAFRALGQKIAKQGPLALEADLPND